MEGIIGQLNGLLAGRAGVLVVLEGSEWKNVDLGVYISSAWITQPMAASFQAWEGNIEIRFSKTTIIYSGKFGSFTADEKTGYELKIAGVRFPEIISRLNRLLEQPTAAAT